MDVYQMITDRVIESLNKGTIPWQKPWQGGKFGQPRNFVSTKAYRGINVFLLSATAEAMGYTSPFWISYKQAQSLGGSVKKGEKSSAPVVFYSQYDRKNTDDEIEKGWILRYTPMFNVGWLKVLKDQNSRKWLTWGASNAQKAADYIQGINIAANKEAA